MFQASLVDPAPLPPSRAARHGDRGEEEDERDEADEEGMSIGEDDNVLLPLSVGRTARGESFLFLKLRLSPRRAASHEGKGRDEEARRKANAEKEKEEQEKGRAEERSTDGQRERSRDWGREGRAWLLGRDWNKSTDHRRPSQLIEAAVVDLACSGSHFLAVTKDGHVHSWGKGSSGQLGHPEIADQAKPLLIKSLLPQHRITKVACGPYHSIALTEQGRILAWGETTVSDDCHVQKWAAPTLVDMQALRQKSFTTICSALNHVAAISSESRPYFWSWVSPSKRHGFGPKAAGIITGMESTVITQICSSKNFISMLSANRDVFTLVLQEKAEESTSYAWTRYDKALGNMSDHDRGKARTHRTRKLYKEAIPTNVIQISCNPNSLVTLLDSGNVTIIDVMESNVVTLSFLCDKRITQISCGQNHLVALSDSGAIYTWGVDSHGALGHGKIVQQKSPVQVKALAEVLVQKVVCSKCCTVAIEDYWATQIFKASIGKISASELDAVVKYFFSNAQKELMPSLNMAVQCYQSRLQGSQAGVYGWIFGAAANVPRISVSTATLTFNAPPEGVFRDKFTLKNESRQEARVAFSLYMAEQSSFEANLDPVPEVIPAGKTWEIGVSLQILQPEKVNMFICVQCDDACYHFIVAKLNKKQTKQSLSSVLGSTADVPPSNTFFDVRTLEGMVIKKIQPTTSFSRRKTTVTSSGSSGASTSTTPPRNKTEAPAIRRIASTDLESTNSSNRASVFIEFNEEEIEYHQVLGRGGSGATVYACSIKGLFFAAKVLKSDFPQKDQVERMLAEISVMTNLKHENVVHYLGYEYAPTKNEVRMYMQLYPETIADVIDRRRDSVGKPWPVHEVVSFCLQIARGLNYLGKQEPPVIHRDLKTQNIFVSWDNHRNPRKLHIGDFDTSKFLESTASRTYTRNIGTTGFMAPEVFGEKGYGVKADVWSFGMILYELLTLRPPYYDAPHPTDISERNMKGQRPTVPAELSQDQKYKGLIDLFVWCTNIKAQKRPSTAEILAALEDILATSRS